MTASEHPAAQSLQKHASTARAETHLSQGEKAYRMRQTLIVLFRSIEFAQMGANLDLSRAADLIRNTLQETA